MKQTNKVENAVLKLSIATIFVTICVFGLDCNAFGYVDPGITGMLFQIGYLAIVAALGALVLFGKKILGIFRRLFTGKASEDSDKV